MNAVSLGPLVLAADRFAVVLGMLVFVLVAGMLARRVDARFAGWSWWVLLGGIAAARLGHVLVNWSSFMQEPWRVVALWQGGFHWPSAAVAVAASVVLVLRSGRLRLWALLPLALAVVVWNTTLQLTTSSQNVALPAMTFAMLDGGTYPLDAPSGTPRVVNLWATWCPPCRREMPMMADVAATTDGLDFVFANQGEDAQRIDAYLADVGLSLELVLLDQFRDLARHYGAPGLPTTLFIAADGTLQHAHLGEISREVLQARIAALLDDQP